MQLTQILFILIYSLIAVIFLSFAFRIVNKFENYLISRIEDNSKWQISSPYTTIVQAIIDAMKPHLERKGINVLPDFEIRYYENKKRSGHFNGNICVYTKNHQTMEEFVNTVLHEIKHFIQFKTDPHYRYYDDYTQTYGYRNNPFEREARKFAKEHAKQCLIYLEQQSLISRK